MNKRTPKSTRALTPTERVQAVNITIEKALAEYGCRLIASPQLKPGTNPIRALLIQWLAGNCLGAQAQIVALVPLPPAAVTQPKGETQ